METTFFSSLILRPKLTAFVITAVMLMGQESAAQVPANNLCANAITVTCNSTTNGTTVASTNTGAPGTCVTSLNTAGGVWYKVIGWGGDITVSLCNSSYDTKIGVLTGACGAFSCVKGNDDDTGPGGAQVCDPDTQNPLASSTTFTSVSGTTYYIYVTGFGTGTGTFELVVTCGDFNYPCPANGLNLEFQTDANGGQISWEIIPQGLDLFACRGEGLPSNAVVTNNCCLPNGCYRLRVMDSAGDGMANGGYILRTENGNQRVIDNRNNFLTGSLSAISGDQSFCLPIGTDKLIYTSCDKLDWVTNTFIVASENPAVSAEWIPNGANSVQDANSGYEFWFFDPNGSYSFKRFRTHNQADGFGNVGATRAAHMLINNWAIANHIPTGVLMNVRVRGVVNGNALEWGPACRFKIDPVAAQCPMTKLMDIPGNQFLSCGQYRMFVNNQYVHARPVSGASQYQFRFRQAAEGFEVVRTNTTYFVPLGWTNAPSLLNGSQYDVDVRAYKNGQWCPWGEVCVLNISTPVQGGGVNMDITSEEQTIEMTVWPNPNSGGNVYLKLSETEQDVTGHVQILDLGGRILHQENVVANSEVINVDITSIASGTYILNFMAGDRNHTTRLVVQ
jgi:hypothetical protein